MVAKMTEKPVISSALLGLHAYQRAQGRPVGKLSDAKGIRVRRPDPSEAPLSPPVDRSAREMKVSMLRTLQAQSNAGLVNIRDVSSALDKMLKST